MLTLTARLTAVAERDASPQLLRDDFQPRDRLLTLMQHAEMHRYWQLDVLSIPGCLPASPFACTTKNSVPLPDAAR
jgi:hypothetical protein